MKKETENIEEEELKVKFEGVREERIEKRRHKKGEEKSEESSRQSENRT